MELKSRSDVPQQTAAPPPSSVGDAHSSTAAAEEHPAKKPKAEADPHRKQAQSSSSSTALHDAILTSNAVLTARLRKELQEIWAAERHAGSSTAPLSTTTTKKSGHISSVIPPFKVGTLEMYRRFPEAYDLLMQHHNCNAVQTVLLHDIIDRIDRTASRCTPSSCSSSSEELKEKRLPWMHVADFGCGAGRIETMLVRHPSVRAIYAYDSEAAMLKQCLRNTVRSAAQSSHYSGVSLYPVAPTSPPSSTPVPYMELCDDLKNDTVKAVKDANKSKSTCHTHAPLQLCVWPVPFQAIQDGFLAATRHPGCALIVCAWSLSYVMRMQWGENRWHTAVDAVVKAMVDHLDNSHSAAALVILETLGNGSTEPTRQNTYTQRLEDHFGFRRTWVRTDYEFATRADAERMVRFFFGEKMVAKLSMDPDGVRCRLMECTGIWTLWKAQQQQSGDVQLTSDLAQLNGS